jgi:hypothetical protein
MKVKEEFLLDATVAILEQHVVFLYKSKNKEFHYWEHLEGVNRWSYKIQQLIATKLG